MTRDESLAKMHRKKPTADEDSYVTIEWRDRHLTGGGPGLLAVQWSEPDVFGPRYRYAIFREVRSISDLIDASMNERSQ